MQDLYADPMENACSSEEGPTLPIIQALQRIGLVPMAVVETPGEALFVSDALRKAGVPLIEVAFRTAAAPEAIRALRQACPDMLVGAGTILTSSQVEQAIQAGAQFIVSPGFDSQLAVRCRSAGIPFIPGVATPSEVMSALQYGLRLLKFFPAEAMGGVKTLMALAPVFPHVRFIPTGGIDPRNLMDYIRLPNVIACGGTWLVNRQLIEERRLEDLVRVVQEARALVQQAKGKPRL